METVPEERLEEGMAAPLLLPAAAVEPEEILYRTKVVEFLGRQTPIVLQNDNGPCPLLAICNVLLLRNSLNLSLDASEVSQQKLLSLVAGRLIDFNSNVQDKDDGYVNNQQQNISDAIDLLPRLATGIDVNLHFRKINDFEFTRECAIFDLLDIGLYHGWIVDPQDIETTEAIGSKSYNTLVAELVASEARKSDEEHRIQQEENFVDFAAATTATLGVPSPSLSRGISFIDTPVPVPPEQIIRKGDSQEDEELMRALNISKLEISSPVGVTVSTVDDHDDSSSNTDEVKHVRSSDFITHPDSILQVEHEPSNFSAPEPLGQESSHVKIYYNDVLEDGGSLLQSIGPVNKTNIAVSEESTTLEEIGNTGDTMKINTVKLDQASFTHSLDESSSGRCCSYEDLVVASKGDQSVIKTSTTELSTSKIHEDIIDNPTSPDSPVDYGPAAPCIDLKAIGQEELLNSSGIGNASLAGSEPIYEGEECMLESGHSLYENHEPVYEGEVVLAKQAETIEGVNPAGGDKDLSHKQWKLIRNFLHQNASQITFYGLFCLQEGLRERELCVFFRNNHFSTIFKFNGELYLLATDQGYIHQPDLVWEKLNEVNGDTIFMTGNFKEFKADNQASNSWNEQSAMSSTAEYIAALESSSPSSTLNSDLQLAIELQQHEFEQQPQRRQVQQQLPQQQHPKQQHPQQQHPRESPVAGRSRLITGPQASSRPAASQKTESKSKEKCKIM